MNVEEKYPGAKFDYRADLPHLAKAVTMHTRVFADARDNTIEIQADEKRFVVQFTDESMIIDGKKYDYEPHIFSVLGVLKDTGAIRAILYSYECAIRRYSQLRGYDSAEYTVYGFRKY